MDCLAEACIALATLIALEVALGVDNIICISILAAKLPEHQRATARQGGIAAAATSRLGSLFAIAWIWRWTWCSRWTRSPPRSACMWVSRCSWR
jgi:predicted tellurium resistance membrane protein TerC